MGVNKTLVRQIGTPALLVDLPSMEYNLAKMAEFFAGKTAKLRAHFKNHRVLALASRQVEAGAIGITCARIWQAEALVNHGIRSVLIANEVVDESYLKRLVAISQEAEVIVAVDDAKVVQDMARLARNARTQPQVVVDVEVGLKRCGVRPGEAAVRLAKIVLENGLKLRGLMGYEGHLQQIPPGPEKEAAIKSSLQPLIDCKCLLEREGIPVEIVTCGGTGTSAVAATIPGVTEIQAGSYLLMETNYAKFVPQFKVSLSMLTSVISKTPGERIVVDAGIKALSTGRGMPSVKSITGLQLHTLHAEHGLIAIEDPSVAVEVGDKIEIWVHYADGTLQLHNQMYGIRNDEVEEVFKIEA